MNLNNVAGCLVALGRAGEALPLYEASRAMRNRLFRGDHPDAANSLYNVARCLRSLGCAAEAGQHDEEAVKMARRLRDPNLVRYLGALGSRLVALGDADRATAVLEEAANVFELRR